MNTQIQNNTTNLNRLDSLKPSTNKVDFDKLSIPKEKTPLKFILSSIILILLVIGSIAALYLTQINQDVRQQASSCAYWVGGGAAIPGSCDDRGGIIQVCKNGYWSAPSGDECGGTGTEVGTGTGTTVPEGGCVGTNCTSPPGGCIAIHHCNEIASNGECTVLTPTVTTGNVNAQEEANSSCQCVQVDVLTGGSGSCDNGHINGDWSTLIGASIVCPDASANCGTPEPSPTTPEPTPQVSPSPSPLTYFCDSTCETDRQCRTAGNGLTCSDGKCRLETNPTSTECRPAVGPMCLDIDLANAQTGIPLTEDPSLGDSIQFTCADVANVDHYVFRVIEPNGNIVDLDSTGRTSTAYTIVNDGKHFAQCQICTTENDLSCNPYEALN